MVNFIKNWVFFLCIIATTLQNSLLNASAIGETAIIGGTENLTFPFAAFVTSDGVVSPLTGPALPTGNGQIFNVAINASGAAIIGGVGVNEDTPYAALVTPNGVTTPLSGPALPTGLGAITSVAINNSGNAIIGGIENFSGAYAALVDPNGVTTPITGPALPVGGGLIASVAINHSGAAIIGGMDGNNIMIYAALVNPNGVTTPLSGSGFPVGGGSINSVAINHSGTAIIGGQSSNVTPYAAVVDPNGVTTAFSGPALPVGGGLIASVAINSSGAGIIGGVEGDGENPYAALIDSSGVTTPLSGSALPIAPGIINSVAINHFGAGIIGGIEGNDNTPYAALVDPNGVTTPLSGSPLPTGNGSITSVSINCSGAAIIGGADGTAPFVALVAPNGVTTPLSGSPLPITGRISSVAFPSGTHNKSVLSEIDPKSFGPGNTFASSLLALSTVVLQNHLTSPLETDFNRMTTASLTADAQGGIRQPPSSNKRPRYSFWLSPFGQYARYKKERSFPSLKDRSIGGIVGFDYLGYQGITLGAGGAYAYQNVGYSGQLGSAKTHQEFLTFYANWDKKNFSIQSALWGGLYQMKNERKTLGFIPSTSHLKGWLFSPHLEINSPFHMKNKVLTIKPFAMFDWVNNWQGSVKEEGKSGFNLRIDPHYVSLLRSEIGLRLLQSLQFKRGNLTLEEGLSYVNQLPFNAKKSSAYYVGSISTFNLQMFSNRIENIGALRLSGQFTPSSFKCPHVSLTYQGELSSNLQAQTLALEIRQRF